MATHEQQHLVFTGFKLAQLKQLIGVTKRIEADDVLTSIEGLKQSAAEATDREVVGLSRGMTYHGQHGNHGNHGNYGNHANQGQQGDKRRLDNGRNGKPKRQRPQRPQRAQHAQRRT